MRDRPREGGEQAAQVGTSARDQPAQVARRQAGGEKLGKSRLGATVLLEDAQGWRELCGARGVAARCGVGDEARR